MPKIAYIMLCHKDPQAVIEQAKLLTAAGDYVSIHFDKRSSHADYNILLHALGNQPNIVFANKRIKCGWGEWSLVQATLHAVEAALHKFPRATHFYMISGDCLPIKSAQYVHEFLKADNADFIESFDFFTSQWIKTGMTEERLIYRHFFNERTQPKLFYWSYNIQTKLGLTRKIPEDLEIQIGSQWWCLRRSTIEAILEFIKLRPDVRRFFSTTWIPDETFFQTLVRHLVPSNEIRTRTLTFLMFTDYGLPVVFYNDHYDMLLAQNYLFARKISAEAKTLRSQLSTLYTDETRVFHISDNGANLFRFLTTRGRVGRRFGARFWETDTTLGRQRELLIVVCKKWHIAKRFLAQLRRFTDMPVLEFIFNEEITELPNLGGIEKTLRKRTRHRRALLKMLYNYYETNQLMICLDPADFDILKDLAGGHAQTRILEIACDFSPAYVRGHALRVGLVQEWTHDDLQERFLPTVRQELYFEQHRIREAGFEHQWTVSEAHTPAHNARQLSKFIDITPKSALKLMETLYLFSD